MSKLVPAPWRRWHERWRRQVIPGGLSCFSCIDRTQRWRLPCRAVACIAAHPHVQARIIDELHAAGIMRSGVRAPCGDLAYEQLADLPYLDAAIDESCRLMPGAPNGTIRWAAVLTCRGLRPELRLDIPAHHLRLRQGTSEGGSPLPGAAWPALQAS